MYTVRERERTLKHYLVYNMLQKVLAIIATIIFITM